jgi:hypothetical protein
VSQDVAESQHVNTHRLLFLAAAAALGCLWLAVALSRRRQPKNLVAFAELRYSRPLRLFALIIALAIPALMGYVISRDIWINQRYLSAAGSAFLIMSWLGGLLLLETERACIYLTDDAIVGYSPWRLRRDIRWDEIHQVSYSALNRWFVIVGPTGVIRASRSLVGLPALLAELQKRAPARCSTQVLALARRLAGPERG